MVPNDHCKLCCITAGDPTHGARRKYGAARKFDAVEVRVGGTIRGVVSFGEAVDDFMGPEQSEAGVGWDAGM